MIRDNTPKKVAIIGSGISGLGSAFIALKNHHHVTLFEKNNYFGGHSNTIDISLHNQLFPVDTGFLVHNKLNYPNLIQLFDLLDIKIVDSNMSLSINILEKNIEWCGNDLNTVFGQRINIFRPSFYYFLYEILRFNKSAQKMLEWSKSDENRTLQDLLNYFKFSSKITNWYVIPMAAAIWSTPADKILEFPAHTFLTFSLNHRLLQVNNRPIWRTIKGGSREYVKKIIDMIPDKRLNQNIVNVRFENNHVYILTDHNNQKQEEVFDFQMKRIKY